MPSRSYSSVQESTAVDQPLLPITNALFVSGAPAAKLTVGAAPSGDPTKVASRIIKYNFPSCRKLSNAVRAQDGSIRATCDAVSYLVFTVFNPREGKVIEVALNCAAAKTLLNTSCWTIAAQYNKAENPWLYIPRAERSLHGVR